MSFGCHQPGRASFRTHYTPLGPRRFCVVATRPTRLEGRLQFVDNSIQAADQTVGLSRDDVYTGMTVTAGHMLQERSFDLVAALFGAPDQTSGEIPDAANAMLTQGVVLDFNAHRLPGSGSEVLSQELHFTLDPPSGRPNCRAGCGHTSSRGRQRHHHASA
jgi:hypothetical protein